MWKTCTKCGRTKALWAFNRNKRFEFGVQCTCSACIRQYRDANKDKVSACKKAHYDANKDRLNSIMREKTAALSTCYVVNKICIQTGITREEITPELIELKRDQLKLLRAINEVNHGITRARN